MPVHGKIISRESAKRLEWGEYTFELGCGQAAPAPKMKIMADHSAQPDIGRRQGVGATETTREHILHRPLAKAAECQQLFANAAVILLLESVEIHRTLHDPLGQLPHVLDFATRKTASHELSNRGGGDAGRRTNPDDGQIVVSAASVRP